MVHSWRVVALAASGLLATACGRPASSEPAHGVGGMVYASNETAGRIEVLDVARARLGEPIPVGKRPRGLRLTPDGRTLLVALSGSPIAGPHVDPTTLPPPDRSADGIAVVDLAERRVVRVIESGQDPESCDLARDGRRLYVSNEETGEVAVVDVEAGTVARRIPVGREPEGVTTRPDGGVVYVTSEGDGTVAVIDTARDQVVATIAVGARPRTVVFSPDSAWAYVSAEQDASVAVVDARAHRVIARIPIPPGRGRVFPMGLALSPDGQRLYVTGGRGRSVTVIDTELRAVTHTLADVGQRPWGIVATTGGALVTANGPSKDLSIIDARTGVVRARVRASGSPWGVVVAERAAPPAAKGAP